MNIQEHVNSIAHRRSAVKQFADQLDANLSHIDNDLDIDAAGVDDICALYLEIEELARDMRHVIARAHKTAESFKVRRILDKLEDMGVDKVSVPSLGRSFYPKSRNSATLVSREAGMEWLRANGAGDLIHETVNHQTLTSFVKGMIEDQGIDPPADLITFKSHRYIGSSAYTPKGVGE